MHKEIGGYLELERFTGPMLHEKALALSSGRACLSYLIEQRGIRKIALPDFNCDVVEAVCRAHGLAVNTELLYSILDRQTVGIPASLTLDLIATHGLVAVKSVFYTAG